MKQATQTTTFAPRRGPAQNLAMNAALMVLLAAVYLWSAAGNAVEQVLGVAKG